MDSQPFIPNNTDLTEEAHEIFRRVWKRVMPDSQDSPIVIDSSKRVMTSVPNYSSNHKAVPELPPSNKDAKALQQDLKAEERLPHMEVLDVDNLSTVISHHKNDFPPRSAVPCLGSQNMPYEKLLQKMIQKELRNWHYYRTLARSVGGNVARVFASMAAADLQNAKRLSAAYFLISGVHFWPERGITPHITSYLTALRERFIDEQQDAAQYIAVATETSDPCLSQLLLEIAEGSLRHAHQIRLLVEQL